MSNDLETILGVQAPQSLKLKKLERPKSVPFKANETNRSRVRERLIDLRKGESTWKDPKEQKRRRIRDLLSKGKTDYLSNTDNWEFSNFEIGRAIDSLLIEGHQDIVGDVVALMEMSPLLSRDLWLHAQDKKVESLLAKGRKPPQLNNQCRWLDLAVQMGSVDLITVLCHREMSKEDINSALFTSLANNEYALARELLRFGAAFPDSAVLVPAIESHPPDLEYLRLWLTAIEPPNSVATLKAMGTVTCSPPGHQAHDQILDLLLTNWAISPSDAYDLLVSAISARNRLSTIRISRAVNQSWSAAFLGDGGDSAVSKATTIEDTALRKIFIEFLLAAGAQPNTLKLREELMNNVQNNQIDLVKLLIRYGVPPHNPDSSSIDWAVHQANVDVLKILLSADVPPFRASGAVNNIPASASQDVQISLLSLLLQKGATGKPLDKLLVRAVTDNLPSLVRTLLQNKASINFNDASAVRIAIQHTRLELLDTLLNSTIAKPAILVKALPVAMAVSGNEHRFWAVKSLLKKGVKGIEVDVALQTSVSDADARRDGKLISILLEHGASPDFKDAKGNAINIAVTRCQVDLLRELSSKAQEVTTFTEAIPSALAALMPTNYDQIVDMIDILMEKGANGELVEKTLLDAIPIDPKLQIISTLSRTGLTPDTTGSAIRIATRLEDLGALKYFCDTKNGFEPPKDALAEEICTCLYTTPYNAAKALALLGAGRRYPEIMSPLLVHDGLENHSARVEVTALLVLCGASVDFEDGAALKLSCKLGDVDMTRVLLQARPNQTLLAKALDTSIHKGPQSSKFEIISMLLKSSDGNYIGQDEALVEVGRQLSVRQEDTKLVKLLLRHNASADHASGEAISLAAQKMSVPALKELFRKKVKPSSLIAAFNDARSLKCNDDMKHTIFRMILEAGYNPGSSQTLNEALLESLERSPEYFPTPQLMLSHGASIEFRDGEAFCIAARAGSLSTLNRLLQYNIDPKHLSSAFRLLVDSDTHQDLKKAMLTALLEKGVSGELRDWALQAQFKSTDLLNHDLVDLFLHYKASPDCFSGECFSIAASKDDQRAFLALASRKFDIGVVSLALVEKLETSEEIVKWFKLCYQQTLKVGKVKGKVLFTSIKKFPQGEEIVELLLKHGCERSYRVPFEGNKLSLLLWATRNCDVSDSIVLKLLERGDDDWSNSWYQEVITTIAIVTRRISVVRRLIELKVNINWTDDSQLSPLCYAVLANSIEIASLLIQSGARQDDGSLHIAARQCDLKCVSLLLEAGHDPHLPLALLDQRTPLAELCLRAEGTGAAWQDKVQKIMEMIKRAAPYEEPFLWRFDNDTKNVVHLALDNKKNSTGMTKALLSTFKPYQFANIAEDFLFIDDKGLHYSPTKYVELCCPKMSRVEKASLIAYLKTQRFRDRYFADGLDQPAGAVGLPTAIKEAIEEEAEAERKRQREIKRKLELAQLEKKMADELHERNMRNRELETQKEMELARRKAEAENQQQLDFEVRRMRTVRQLEKEKMQELHEAQRSHALELGQIASAQQTLAGEQSLKLKAQGYQMDLMYQRAAQQGLPSSSQQLPPPLRHHQIEYWDSD
ncbi:hypothetical protein F5Y08DRAFT_349264 [Xylaria arbuscula]|nr:hypothetical protein F5Y08DRAFT_349264 [Xylaria arbuscula]